jgi:hypothetical protein
MPEIATRLTKRAVDQAVAMPSRYIIWDSDLSGFGVRIEATGRKTYVVRYRPRVLAVPLPSVS